jgi:hypothetical protein
MLGLKGILQEFMGLQEWRVAWDSKIELMIRRIKRSQEDK